MTQLLIDRGHAKTSGDSVPVAEEIAWPESIPNLFRAVASSAFPIFLDSARFDPQMGRYSYFSGFPFETIRSRDGQVEVRDSGNQPVFSGTTDPFVVLAERLGRHSLQTISGLPPFQGGAAGLFSYDLCHHVERLPRARHDEFAVPNMLVGLYDWVIALDHLLGRAWIISTGLPHSGAKRLEHARAQIERVRMICGDSANHGQSDELSRVTRSASGEWTIAPENSFSWRRTTIRLAPQFPVPAVSPAVTSNFSRDAYLRTVERAIEYIYAGDVYQVNLAQRLLAPLTESPVELYLRLRERNPAPFAGYLDLGPDFVIASASPERFLRVQNGAVETRPIKGTRPRWPAPEADMFSAGELQQSDKDRAENVMIVDLLRNDLGRVCEYGSVRVTNPMRLESYEFVHHLVSEVRGQLRPDCGSIDLLRSAFPGGSVTGAPKIRAMEIIAELEPTVRGPYCGSLGYIGFDGTMDSNILIRTFTCGGGWIQFPVGGGIVAQSSPEREYEETLHKAEGMIRALQK